MKSQDNLGDKIIICAQCHQNIEFLDAHGLITFDRKCKTVADLMKN